MKKEIINKNRREIKRKIFSKNILLLQNKLRKTLYLMEERNMIYIENISKTINDLEMEIEELEATLVILTL